MREAMQQSTSSSVPRDTTAAGAGMSARVTESNSDSPQSASGPPEEFIVSEEQRYSPAFSSPPKSPVLDDFFNPEPPYETSPAYAGYSSRSRSRQRHSRRRAKTVHYWTYRKENDDETDDVSRSPDDESAPPVTFEAAVFEISDNDRAVGPRVVYHAKQPFDPSGCGSSGEAKEPGETPIDGSEAVPQRSLQWNGPVVKVTVSMKARFPESHRGAKNYLGETQGSQLPARDQANVSGDMGGPRRYPTDFGDGASSNPKYSQPLELYHGRSNSGEFRQIEIPRNLDALNVELISRSTIHLLSPFIAETLVGMKGYFPAFLEAVKNSFKSRNVAAHHFLGSSIKFSYPFSELLHQYPAIEAFVKDDTITKSKIGKDGEKDTDAQLLLVQREHMTHLYTVLKPLHEAVVQQCQRYLSESPPSIGFEFIWYLFKPGTNVYVRLDGYWCTAVVRDVRSDTEDLPGVVWGGVEQKWWLLDLWLLATDGQQIGRITSSCRISRYEGIRPITSLVAVPVEIWDKQDQGSRRETILKRSNTFLKALKQGNLLANYRGPSSHGRWYNGKVVIDHRRGFAELGHQNRLLGFVNDECDHFRDYDGIIVNTNQLRDIEPLRPAVINIGMPPSAPPGDSNAATAGSKLTPRLDVPTAHPSSARERTTYGDRYDDGYDDDDDKDYVLMPVKSATSGQRHSVYPLGAEDVYPNADKESVRAVENLTEHQLMLLHPETRAFALKSKTWMVISMEYVEEITSSSDSIDNIVIGEHELSTIRALSNRQSREDEQWSADFIEGKGSGQIILLHGPPGVGKTYTVEAIAELLHRPLLALTVADIGTMETRIEAELVKWFTLAEAWNAVLLVDEADIFLERRQTRDLARNGLVSAFLRRMEYFKGLLFLTTNRVGQIDDAFISRVHVAIGYKALDADDRARIWNGFFRKLVRDRAGKIQVAPDAKKWVLNSTGAEQTDLNGRDIRNALQTAISLAEFEAEEDPDHDPKLAVVVTKSHFERVLSMSNKFHAYVSSIRKEDEKKRASGRGDRNDYDDVQLSMLKFR